MKKQQRPPWGPAGILLAALALGACSKPVEPAAPAAPTSTGGATSDSQPSGIGLKGGQGTAGMTGSFPSSAAAGVRRP